MDEKMGRIIKSTLLAGLAPGVAAPIVWPAVVVLVEGKWPDWHVYPMAALAISSFSIFIAIPSCVTFGSVSLFILEKLDINTPAITGILGLILSLLLYLSIASVNDYPPISQAWPVAAFFSIMGAMCGVIASSVSCTNTALKRDRADRAAP